MSAEESLKLELYRIAVQTRNMEIELFWKRSNYFLVLNTAIAVGFFAKLENESYALILSGFGFVVSLLWFHVNLGSKYWQSRWEHRSSIMERDVAEDANLFSASKEVIRSDVVESLKRFKHSHLRRCLDQYMVETKPSVSLLMISLSGIFAVLWLGVLCMSLLGFGGHGS